MVLEEYCRQLEQRISDLERENARLRGLLGLDIQQPIEATLSVTQADSFSSPNVSEDPIEPLSSLSATSGVHKFSSPAEKIRLFCSMFRGREDVFAKRWYSLTKEKGGYSPVCGNEWKDGICPKPKSSCSKCDHRLSVALSDEAIFQHLSGKDPYGRDVVGIFPILPDTLEESISAHKSGG